MVMKKTKKELMKERDPFFHLIPVHEYNLICWGMLESMHDADVAGENAKVDELLKEIATE